MAAMSVAGGKDSARSQGLDCDVLIVGAGIAGLAARRTLRQRGLRVLLVEKARGIGGRCATRRIGAAIADLGAQEVSAHDPEWRELLLSARDSGTREHDPGRFLHRQGMSRLAGLLLPSDREGIQLETRASLIRPEAAGAPGWRVETVQGASFHARCVVLTAPYPQALELLGASGLKVSSPEIRYAPCLAAVIVLKAGASGLPRGRSWVHYPVPGIESLIDQKAKGLETAETTIVAHGTPQWSRERLEASELADEQLASEFKRLLESVLPSDEIAVIQVHRWRYSVPEKPLHTLYAEVSGSPGLFLAGDAFSGGSAEGAFLSGRAVGREIGARLEASASGAGAP